MFNIIFKIERWKFNKDYGVYVSTEGHFKDRQKRLIPVKIGNGGYCNIKTERGYVLAHRLVMFTWRPIPNAEKLTVDHLNHNKRDNSLTNLEWVTQQENLRRAHMDQLKSKNKKYSIRSTYIPDNIYRKHLIGYNVNGKVCKTEEEIITEVKHFYNGPKEKITESINKIFKNRACKVRLGNANIIPILDTEYIYAHEIN